MNARAALVVWRVRRRAAARRAMRGAIAVVGALWLGVAVICLMAIDIGHVFWQQREVQKIADMAAMAAAAGQSAECASQALLGARRNGLRLDTELESVQCGNWDPKQPVAQAGTGTDRPDQFFVAAREPFNAARVTVRRTVPYFFFFGGDVSRVLTATATAARATPLAVLNIRSTAADFDTSRSPLLNAVVGGLLGGSIDLTAVGWQGLVNTDVDLLSYLDALAVELGVRVGDYEQLLQTTTDVGTLLRVAADVLQRGGNTANATVEAINALLGIEAAVPSGAPLLKLADFLQVQSGSSLSGLDVGLQAMQLVQGVVQAANGKSGLAADVPANLLGLVNARVSVKVIEPPQISAVGDPELARLAPQGPDQIFVRTAQVRTLVSVDLPVLSGVTGLLNTVTAALAPVTNVLNNLLSLNLVGLVESVTCLIACERTLTDVALLPPPLRLDLSIEAGNGQSYISDYQCDASSRSLTTQTRTSLGDVRIGRMGTSALDAKNRVFATRSLPVVDSVPVLDIGSKRCSVLLGVPISCQPRTPYVGGGLGISAQIPIAASDVTQVFSNPPQLDEPPRYQAISTQGIVSSLEDTVRGLNLLKPIPPVSAAEGPGLGNLLTQLTAALSGVINALGNVVSSVLSPLLDPLVDSLLKALGIDVAQTEVSGRLSCSANVELVY